MEPASSSTTTAGADGAAAATPVEMPLVWTAADCRPLRPFPTIVCLSGGEPWASEADSCTVAVTISMTSSAEKERTGSYGDPNNSDDPAAPG
jgi:hypothetical protein